MNASNGWSPLVITPQSAGVEASAAGLLRVVGDTAAVNDQLGACPSNRRPTCGS